MSHRRRVVITAICLTAAVAGAVTTDLVVEHTVRGRVAETAACRLGATRGVQVDLDDTLAGLKALTGTVGTVHVGAEGVRRQGTDMDVDVYLRDVSTGGSSAGGTATATIAYGSLDETADVKSAAGAEGLKTGTDGTHLTLSGTAGGTGMPVTVVTKLTTTTHSLTIAPATVQILGRDVPVSALSALPGADEFADKLKPRTIDIEKLPRGATLTGAHAGSDGLVLDFTVAPGGVGGQAGTASGASGCASGGGRIDG
ncbi:LmeA family phospholipid-binding protein [Streptomyces sp. NPDC005386]|uniref:LmeA family phospholipid-binding protein n=1 Tax=Streptomyces sp. NPDC005386 TaxID=3154562 RepID=UPI0033AC426E